MGGVPLVVPVTTPTTVPVFVFPSEDPYGSFGSTTLGEMSEILLE